MGRHHYSYVRAQRRRHRFTQKQLAALVGITDVAVSRIERSERGTSAAVLIACSIIFGLSGPDLFPTLHAEVEANVLAAAKELLARLANEPDADSKAVCLVLDELIQRISIRDNPEKP